MLLCINLQNRMNVVIIDYCGGNTQSVVFALNRLGVEPVVTADVEQIKRADRVIFPGVGEASTTMRFLKETGLDEVISQLKQPVLGICLGMQLMCSHSAEGDVDCLGIFDVDVESFSGLGISGLKVPHIGWNLLQQNSSLLFADVSDSSYCYFVHSFYVPLCPQTIATCNYGVSFSAALKQDNFYATQFHPEKSEDVGATILENFITQKTN